MFMRPGLVPPARPAPARSVRVFRSADFRVIDGVNAGEALSDAHDLALEDVYALSRRARPVHLGLGPDRGAGPWRISSRTGAGRHGAPVHLDCRLTFMEETGAVRDALVFAEVGADGALDEVYLCPLSPFPALSGHILVDVSPGRSAHDRAPWPSCLTRASRADQAM